MKKTICVFFFLSFFSLLFLFANKSHAILTSEEEWFIKQDSLIQTKYEEYIKELEKYLKKDKGALERLLSITNEISYISSEIYDKYTHSNGYIADQGMEFHRFASQLACEAIITTAKYYAQEGGGKNKGVAKKLYRDLITTYTGNLYKSYVKKAEFGLEDLK